MPIPVHVCKFVNLSDLFKNLPESVYEQLAESDPDFTWGENNRSLITIERLLDHMDAAGIDYPEEFKDMCNKLGLEMYVDLEN